MRSVGGVGPGCHIAPFGQMDFILVSQQTGEAVSRILGKAEDRKRADKREAGWSWRGAGGRLCAAAAGQHSSYGALRIFSPAAAPFFEGPSRAGQTVQ